MFGRKKKNNRKQDADTEALLASEKERKEKEHADLLDRYNKLLECRKA